MQGRIVKNTKVVKFEGDVPRGGPDAPKVFSMPRLNEFCTGLPPFVGEPGIVDVWSLTTIVVV